LTAVLDGGFSPLLLHTEVNPLLPPPLRFTLPLNATAAGVAQFAPQLWTTNGPFYGASLAALADALQPRGYTLLEMDGWDATWVRDDAARLFQPLPATLSSAYAAGFGDRVAAAPACFADGVHPKVYSASLHAQAARVRGAADTMRRNPGGGAVWAAAAAEVQAALAVVRSTLEAAAPRHVVTGEIMPFVLGVGE
jgi:hypothetical protein